MSATLLDVARENRKPLNSQRHWGDFSELLRASHADAWGWCSGCAQRTRGLRCSFRVGRWLDWTYVTDVPAILQSPPWLFDPRATRDYVHPHRWCYAVSPALLPMELSSVCCARLRIGNVELWLPWFPLVFGCVNSTAFNMPKGVQPHDDTLMKALQQRSLWMQFVQ